jgi:hypothetical protein
LQVHNLAVGNACNSKSSRWHSLHAVVSRAVD